MRLNKALPKFCVRVHLPLKQGLRQNQILSLFFSRHVRVHLPLKQGLRLSKQFTSGMLMPIVRVHLPLKQGLRPTLFSCKDR